jgi:hypothetical protein
MKQGDRGLWTETGPREVETALCIMIGLTCRNADGPRVTLLQTRVKKIRTHSLDSLVIVF